MKANKNINKLKVFFWERNKLKDVATILLNLLQFFIVILFNMA